MNPFPFAMAQWRQSRQLLTAMALLIAIGCAISLAVTSVERALREASTRAASRFDLIVGAAGSETQLVLSTVYLQPAALKLMPVEVLKRLQSDAGVVYAVPIASGDSFAGLPIVGTTVDFASAQGQFVLSAGRWFGSNDEAVAGAASSLQLGDNFTPLHGNANENVIEANEHTGKHVQVVGRMAVTGTPWDRAILVPIDAMLELHQHGGHFAGLPAIVVKPRSVMDAYRLRNAYRNDLTTAVFPAETLTTLYRTLGDVRELTFWIASAGQLLVLMAVLLGLYATLSARAQSLAALRAIGASRLFVWLTLWLQAMVTLLSGLAGGVLLACLCSRIAANVLSERISLLLDARLIPADFLPLLILLVAAAMAAAGVAWRAYQAPLSAALRS